MKKTNTCPKCQSKEILHFFSVPDRAHGLFTANSNMNLGTYQNLIYRGGAELESYACKKCGYVEFYVIDVSELDNFSEGLAEEI